MMKTRLTNYLDIDCPILSAPMAFAAGGKLAAAVSNAGGLGFIGGGYADEIWLDEQFRAAGNASVGCGFITWDLKEAEKRQPGILESVLQRKPTALFLSFGDPSPFAKKIEQAGVDLYIQVQTLADAFNAVDCGADMIIAQGAEAGGHGEKRATMTLVPEIADMLAKRAPDTLLCAAGGIADGRGLAASLMLGADGVVVGSRFWASQEALVHPNMLDEAIGATGDDTIRSSVMDIARHKNWPERYTARVLKNAFTKRWHGDIEGLLAQAEEEAAKWSTAWQTGDMTIANTFVGEAAGLIDEVQPASKIVEEMVAQAENCLSKFRSF